MDGYCPGQSQWNLSKRSRSLLNDFFGLWMKGILNILPNLLRCGNIEFFARTANNYLLLIQVHYFPDFSVEVALFRRTVVFNKHNLRSHFQAKFRMCWKHILRKVTSNLGFIYKGFTLQFIQFRSINSIGSIIMSS